MADGIGTRDTELVSEPEPAGMSTEEAMLDMLADHEYRLGLMEVGLGPEGVQQNEQMP